MMGFSTEVYGVPNFQLTMECFAKLTKVLNAQCLEVQGRIDGDAKDTQVPESRSPMCVALTLA